MFLSIGRVKVGLNLSKHLAIQKVKVNLLAILLINVLTTFQITWSRLEDEFRPYSLLTIGDQNYVEDKRFFVARPLRGPNNVSIY